MWFRRLGVLAFAVCAAFASAQNTKLEELRQFHKKVEGMPAAARLAGYEIRKRMEAAASHSGALGRKVRADES